MLHKTLTIKQLLYRDNHHTSNNRGKKRKKVVQLKCLVDNIEIIFISKVCKVLVSLPGMIYVKLSTKVLNYDIPQRLSSTPVLAKKQICVCHFHLLVSLLKEAETNMKTCFYLVVFVNNVFILK